MVWQVGRTALRAATSTVDPNHSTRVADAEQIRHLEKRGRLPHVESLDMRWIWLIPPTLVVLLLLMLF
ncbi:hypothetical protein ACIBEK_06990 [Nocardia fusca]|uniref:hypothetical protein n=1 Tax=Nocardia fusca TaxID=941183 RepID=UPI0037AEDD42